MDDFAKAPQSITELKANRSHDAKDWTPRDALIDMLRRIDAGEIEPIDALIISYRTKNSEGKFTTRFSAASPDLSVSVGLLTRVAWLVNDQ